MHGSRLHTGSHSGRCCHPAVTCSSRPGWVVRLSGPIVCLCAGCCLQPCCGWLSLVGTHGWRAGSRPTAVAARLCCVTPEESRSLPREAFGQGCVGDVGQISWFRGSQDA